MNSRFVSVLLFLCICLVLSCAPQISASEESADAIFSHASELYEKGDYFNALARYEEVLDEGYVSGYLYYNIGNCYVKQDEVGQAILFYERARRLLPRDADVRANYAYARSLVKASGADDSSFWLGRLVRGITDPLSVDELTVVMSVIFCLALVVWGLAIVRIIETRTFVWIIASLVSVLLVGGWGLSDSIRRITTTAVVVEEEVQARYGPFERATTHFTVFEGLHVSVEEEKGSWLKIKRRDGNSGWVPNDSVVRV